VLNWPANAEPIEHTGAERFDEHVALGDQRACALDAGGLLQVEALDALAAVPLRSTRRAPARVAAVTDAVRRLDACDGRTVVGEDHACDRARLTVRQVEDAQTLEDGRHRRQSLLSDDDD
jgi:hypothetical protein